MAVDKEAMRRDYEAGMTLRAIALKYGCSHANVSKNAKKGGWERKGGDQVSAESTTETGGAPDATDYQRVRAMACRMLDRVGESLDDPEPISAKDLRSLAATLLDVRQLLNALAPIEAEEQRLRLESLRRQIQDAGEQNSREVTVRFVDTEGAEQ